MGEKTEWKCLRFARSAWSMITIVFRIKVARVSGPRKWHLEMAVYIHYTFPSPLFSFSLTATYCCVCRYEITYKRQCINIFYERKCFAMDFKSRSRRWHIYWGTFRYFFHILRGYDLLFRIRGLNFTPQLSTMCWLPSLPLIHASAQLQRRSRENMSLPSKRFHLQVSSHTARQAGVNGCQLSCCDLLGDDTAVF
jgi:hypothetical protein